MPGMFEAIRLPQGFWERTDTVDALKARDIGRLFHLVQKYAGASQTQIGIATGIAQGKISTIMAGTRKVVAIDVLVRIADGLGMPDTSRAILGLAPTHTTSHMGMDTRRSGYLNMALMESLSTGNSS